MENCNPITQCLACGSENLVATLDLGTQPLANNFRDTANTQYEKRYPLAINRCTECNHLQLTHAVDPKLIYTHYLYVSGTSSTYVGYMEWYANFVSEQFEYWPAESVLDIGCNDGSQLDEFKKLNIQTYGVDPAENLFPISRAKHLVVCGFWNEDSAECLQRNSFDIISTQNSFAHIPNPLEYLQLAKKYLHDDGLIFISTSQADMVLNGEFDTIYHEHISYYNAYSMQCLVRRAGLYLIDVIKTPIHGTSYIFVLSKQPTNQRGIQNILAIEKDHGLMQADTYTKWVSNLQRLLQSIHEQINLYRDYGYRIVGYGAAAIGMTLLNAANILLDVVIDDNPLKQGLFCPGSAIPVVNINYLNSLKPDDKVVFIPLAWNFYDEIKCKIQAIRSNEHDMFMRYFPKLTCE